MNKESRNKQEQHWNNRFSDKAEMFGNSPSVPALNAINIFKKNGVTNILELGAGQGRDTLFFAKNGFNIKALDYSKSGIKDIIHKANKLKLDKFIKVKYQDIRRPIPFSEETFDACYSHMLFCMAFTNEELEILSNEINRVLKFNGISIYSVRHTGDGDYKKGIYRGKDLYETGGFIVNFFSKEKIKKLSNGYKIINIEKFEEGSFPRKLFQVTLKKVKNI